MANRLHLSKLDYLTRGGIPIHRQVKDHRLMVGTLTCSRANCRAVHLIGEHDVVDADRRDRRFAVGPGGKVALAVITERISQTAGREVSVPTRVLSTIEVADEQRGL